MTEQKDSFQAQGPSAVGFLANSGGITVGAQIWGQQVGVEGNCASGNGVHGHSESANASGVWGENIGGGNGVSGSTSSASASGVWGDNSGGGNGVSGSTSSPSASGVWGNNSGGGNGVSGSTSSVFQGKDSTAGVWGDNHDDGPGVKPTSRLGDGVFGYTTGSTHAAVSAVNAGGGVGLWAEGRPFAAHFEGDVEVLGTLTKSGGSFRIDHPLDPANKYLYHSFVESLDMKNIYDGVVILGGDGEAVVALPDWFESLNKDFRYQLTSIGAAAPNLHVAQEVNRNRFKIAGGNARMKISWTVTGIRRDAWANEHRIPVEEEKPAEARGRYLRPVDRAEFVENLIGSDRTFVAA